MTLHEVSAGILMVLLLVVAPASAAGMQGGRCTRDIAEVRRLERAWLNAYEARDSRAMTTILEDRFTITHFDGSVQRKGDVVGALANIRQEPKTTYSTEDVEGRCYRSTVILTGWIVESDGDRSRSRYTDTYVRLQGKWKVAASHLSRPRRR